MPLLSLFTGESRGRLPLRRRRRGRLERLRRRPARRGRRAAGRGPRARERAQLPVELPDLGRATAAARSAIAEREVRVPVPDLGRAAAAARGVLANRPRPEPPQFLREQLRVDRVTALQRRGKRRGPLAGDTSPLILILAAVAGAAVGLGIVNWLTQRRAAMRECMRVL